MNSGTTVNLRLALSAQTADGIIIARLAGELDLASAPVLREQLLDLLRRGSSQLIIDLSEVSFCDASGLAVLVGASRRARLLGGFLRLAGVPPQADQVLHSTGLRRHLPIFPTVRAAAASPAGAQPAGARPPARGQACPQAQGSREHRRPAAVPLSRGCAA